MKNTTEQWKQVVGYEGLYEVSESGQVFSVPRVDIKGVPRGGHLMKTRTEKAGYLSVALMNDGVMKRRKIHSLVIEAFVGSKPSPEMVCRHWDDVKLNNHFTNLLWGTRLENKGDAIRNGKSATRERNGGGGKLKEAQITEIKRLLEEGCTGASIAKLFDVTRGMIYHIAKGRAWK